MDSEASEAAMNNNVVDPLVEQMESILRLGRRNGDSSQRRNRRYSDADRPAAELPARAEPVAVRSRDGTRWLPAPDERSLKTGQRREPLVACDQESRPSQSLEQHVCGSGICAVTRVFGTTELLELILSFLDTKDVLSLRLMNRQWNSTIHESPQLRLHFFTFGQWGRPGSQFQILPINIPGLSIKQGDELHLGSWITITLTPQAAKRICPVTQPTRRLRSRSVYEALRGGLGSRPHTSWRTSGAPPTMQTTTQYKDLFVTQPPVLGAQAFIIYSPKPTNGQGCPEDQVEFLDEDLRACAKLSCDAGITLEFLADTAQSLLGSQSRAAGPSHLREAKVVFKTIMSFCPPEQVPRKRNITWTVTPLS